MCWFLIKDGIPKMTEFSLTIFTTSPSDLPAPITLQIERPDA